MIMNYTLFCYILNDNLVYEFADSVSADEREEWQQDWYADFKHTYWATSPELTATEQVVGWMREAFSEVTFDTHNFQLKPELQQS